MSGTSRALEPAPLASVGAALCSSPSAPRLLRSALRNTRQAVPRQVSEQVSELFPGHRLASDGFCLFFSQPPGNSTRRLIMSWRFLCQRPSPLGNAAVVSTPGDARPLGMRPRNPDSLYREMEPCPWRGRRDREFGLHCTATGVNGPFPLEPHSHAVEAAAVYGERCGELEPCYATGTALGSSESTLGGTGGTGGAFRGLAWQ